MNRRKFLKQAAVTSVALGSFEALAGTALADDGEKRYHFLVLSRDGGGTGSEALIISGEGGFGSGDVSGGGVFDHFKLMPPAPLPVLGTGTWKAKKFVSFTLAPVTASPEGRHGVLQAGILKLTADFRPQGHAPVKDVAIEIVCNLGPAGASNPGKAEGVTVTRPDGHKFEPQKPTTLGVTAFSTEREEDDD